MSIEQRNKTLAELARYTGRIMPAAFFRKTSDFIRGVEHLHTLLTGIYKPAWSEYALCIKMAPRSPYEHKDEVIFLDDGRWLMTYSPRSGGLEISDNRALVKCMDQRLTVGVIQQITDKTQGSTYKVLGLGTINNYDPVRDVFVVESADASVLTQVVEIIPDEVERYEVQLYAQLTNEFRPMVAEDRVAYMVSAPKRDQAFRELLLNEYDYACVVCGMKFRVDKLYEAQAAHIVPKRRSGTDDPRNGLALCRSHHWAFDAGLFSLNQNNSILVSSLVRRAETVKFELLSLEGNPIAMPKWEGIAPHPTAIEWHRENVFRE